MQLCMYVRSERNLNSQVDSRMTGSCGTMPFALCRSISFLCNKNIKIAMLLHASCHNPTRGRGGTHLDARGSRKAGSTDVHYVWLVFPKAVAKDI